MFNNKHSDYRNKKKTKEKQIKEQLTQNTTQIQPIPKPKIASVKPDLKELERQLNPVEDIPKMLVCCDGCKGTTYDIDLSICNDCGKVICPGCSNVEATSGALYCESCWINH